MFAWHRSEGRGNSAAFCILTPADFERKWMLYRWCFALPHTRTHPAMLVLLHALHTQYVASQMGANIANIVPAATATELHKCVRWDTERIRAGYGRQPSSTGTASASKHTYYQLFGNLFTFCLFYYFSPRKKNNIIYLFLCWCCGCHCYYRCLHIARLRWMKKKQQQRKHKQYSPLARTPSHHSRASTFLHCRTTRACVCVRAFLLPLLLYF